jgi:hypothetical protein
LKTAAHGTISGARRIPFCRSAKFEPVSGNAAIGKPLAGKTAKYLRAGKGATPEILHHRNYPASFLR